MRTPQHDVLSHYDAHFYEGMTDLSSSSLGGAYSAEETGFDYPMPGGLPELREAIAALYPGLSGGNIVVTNGASEALAAVAFALLEARDLAVAAPGAYPSFTRIAARLGAKVECGGEPTLSARLLLLNNPTVPHGRLLPMASIITAAEQCGTRVVADEVYLDLTGRSVATPAALLSPTAISIGDLSKPLGLGGLRIGWLASHDRAALDRISAAVQVLSGGPGTPSMALALDAILEYPARFESRARFALSNGELVQELLREFGWHFAPPEMGWTFLAHPPSPITAPMLERLHSERLFLVPGESLGAPGGFRLSLFASPAALRKALEVLANPRPIRDGFTLVVLAKSPAAGLSKTRLAAAIGSEAAGCLAEAFLEDTFAVASSVGVDTLVAYTPATARQSFMAMAPAARFVAQPDGDLGERILAALRTALDGRGKAVLIGTDTPHLPAAAVHGAISQLDRADVVLGPAEDGGFYLIGVRAHHASLFHGVEWSTGGVFEQVVANAAGLGLSVSCLETITDIDDLESLHNAEPAIQRSLTANSTRQALARVTTGVPRGA